MLEALQLKKLPLRPSEWGRSMKSNRAPTYRRARNKPRDRWQSERPQNGDAKVVNRDPK